MSGLSFPFNMQACTTNCSAVASYITTMATSGGSGASVSGLTINCYNNSNSIYGSFDLKRTLFAILLILISKYFN